MRIEFYKKDHQTQFDITINGTSLITGKKSIVSDLETPHPIYGWNKSDAKIKGFFIHPELINKSRSKFPKRRTQKDIIDWLIKSKLFNFKQSLILKFNKDPELLLDYVYKRPECFITDLMTYVKINKREFDDYFLMCESGFSEIEELVADSMYINGKPKQIGKTTLDKFKQLSGYQDPVKLSKKLEIVETDD